MIPKIGQRLSALLGGSGKKWLIWLGVAGIALIALSEVLPSAAGRQDKTAAVTLTARQVEQALETRMTALLQQVKGVGSCRVMVTLENDVQTVYAASSSSSSVSGADGSASQSATENLLTVQTGEGPVGLRLTEIQPSVRGVAVVCDGGDNPAVCEQVTALITTAFHISERRVCVVKQK